MIIEDISESIFQMSEAWSILSPDFFCLFSVFLQNILKKKVFIQNSHGYTNPLTVKWVEIPPQLRKPVTLSMPITKAITETSDEEIRRNVACNTHSVLQKPSGIHSTCKVFLTVSWSPTADRPRRQYYSYSRGGGTKPSALFRYTVQPCMRYIYYK